MRKISPKIHPLVINRNNKVVNRILVKNAQIRKRISL